jgi:hypothetical protein
MNKLWRGFSQLARWQKIVLVAMMVLIVLTWLTVGLILLGYVGP